MAWSWGCSKVLDALYNGAAEELSINPESAIVTGVSRWGKAAAVCGAFDTRFKMTAPSCSGAGGLALYRYKSEGKTYDFSSKGGSASYTYDANEPLSNLQSSGEEGWFNTRFLEFRDPQQLPVDQHMLGALCADPNRYLFIIASCQGENWVNAPSMWMSYLGMRHVWDYLGLSDHLAINVHLSGHAVIEEDMKYMCQYFDWHVYGIEPKDDLSKLQTSVFALPKNSDGRPQTALSLSGFRQQMPPISVWSCARRMPPRIRILPLRWSCVPVSTAFSAVSRRRPPAMKTCWMRPRRPQRSIPRCPLT